MLRLTLLAVMITGMLVACGKAPGDSSGAAQSAKADGPAPLLVSPQDLRTLTPQAQVGGPVITGTVQPERRADLRAEVSAVVLQVLKENGDSVRRGDLLVRLDDTSIRDSVQSAEESARVAAQSLEQAERQFQRLKTLQAQGMSSTQAMEDAETRRNNAQSDLVAAKARAVQARQQLQRTEVRAPFDGVVSERKVSVGDTAQVGKELIKVIDPRSLRFEGLVAADRLADIKVGQGVHFRVNGHGNQGFQGRVQRVDVAANPVTRQVEVIVAFAEGDKPKAAGLYAEGHVESSANQALLLEEASIQRAGDKAYAWRLQSGKLNKVAVTLGERDVRTGNLPVLSGLKSGDQVLIKPGSSFKEGQPVEMLKVAVQNAAAGK